MGLKAKVWEEWRWGVHEKRQQLTQHEGGFFFKFTILKVSR
jgi:hypothetical protein